MERTSRQNVAIPSDLHATLKALADARGMKLKILIERALRAFLKKAA